MFERIEKCPLPQDSKELLAALHDAIVFNGWDADIDPYLQAAIQAYFTAYPMPLRAKQA